MATFDKENLHSFNIRVPKALHAELAAAAEARGVSVNYLSKRAIRDFLDRLVPVDEIVLTRDGGAGVTR